MRSFLERISSRKFLTAIAAQVAGLVALLYPSLAGQSNAVAVQIAGLAVMLLAAFGYGAVEAAVDAAQKPAGDE